MKTMNSVRILAVLSVFATLAPSIAQAHPFEDYPGQRAYIEEVRKMGTLRMQWEMTKRTAAITEACGGAAVAQAGMSILFLPASLVTVLGVGSAETIAEAGQAAQEGRTLASVGPGLRVTHKMVDEQFHTVFKDLPEFLFSKGSACQHEYDKFVDVLAEDLERTYRGAAKAVAVTTKSTKSLASSVGSAVKTVEEAAMKAAEASPQKY